MTHALLQGDVANVLAGYRDNVFDALFCDPPYGFRFMGKAWDYDVPSADTWRECLRVLKPGAPLLAFGGSRTYHRLACGIEDAGFELRDQLLFLYGKGFPKSLQFGCRCGQQTSKRQMRYVPGADLSSPEHAATEQGEVLFEVVPAGDSDASRAIAGAYGSRAPQGSRPSEQRLIQPAIVREQRRTQEIGSRCEACGGVVGWTGYGTALKPAFEPIVLARKPLEGTMAQNVARWGVGGLAIDACRVGYANQADAAAALESFRTRNSHGAGSGDYGLHGDNAQASIATSLAKQSDGRWPANLILGHSPDCRPTGETRAVKNGTAVKRNGVVAGTGASFGIAKPVGTPDAGYGEQQVEVWDCADDCPVRLLDEQAGPRPSAPFRANEAAGAVLPLTRRTAGGYSDAGGPSRFFYTTKVSTKEREAGCEHLARKSAGECTNRNDYESDAPWIVEGGEPSRPAGLDNPRAGAGRTGGARNHHPTLKPLALTTWLARLVLPPSPGAILIPFSGAGSEMIGALKAGWPWVVGIEREAEYLEIARARLAHWCAESEAA